MVPVASRTVAAAAVSDVTPTLVAKPDVHDTDIGPDSVAWPISSTDDTEPAPAPPEAFRSLLPEDEIVDGYGTGVLKRNGISGGSIPKVPTKVKTSPPYASHPAGP
jgi:hypothetical protein